MPPDAPRNSGQERRFLHWRGRPPERSGPASPGNATIRAGSGGIAVVARHFGPAVSYGFRKNSSSQSWKEAPMPPKLPLPRGWKRHVRSSVLRILALDLLDSTTNMLFLGRPVSLDQYTPLCTQNAYCSVLGRGQNQSSGQPARLDDPHAILLRTTAATLLRERPQSAGIR